MVILGPLARCLVPPRPLPAPQRTCRRRITIDSTRVCLPLLARGGSTVGSRITSPRVATVSRATSRPASLAALLVASYLRTRTFTSSFRTLGKPNLQSSQAQTARRTSSYIPEEVPRYHVHTVTRQGGPRRCTWRHRTPLLSRQACSAVCHRPPGESILLALVKSNHAAFASARGGRHPELGHREG